MNPTINYLSFCKNLGSAKFLTLYKDINVLDNDKEKVLKKDIEISVIDYNALEDCIEIKIKTLRTNEPKNYIFRLKWNDEIPFTHFKNAEDAYKHCKFTKVPLGENLENYIFSRSPKFAVKYAINISQKRLSTILEQKILNSYRYVLDYCIYFDIDLTEKQEESFLKDPYGEFVATYALKKIKGKLPETLHNYLIMKFADKDRHRSYWINKYFESIK